MSVVFVVEDAPAAWCAARTCDCSFISRYFSSSAAARPSLCVITVGAERLSLPFRANSRPGREFSDACEDRLVRMIKRNAVQVFIKEFTEGGDKMDALAHTGQIYRAP